MSDARTDPDISPSSVFLALFHSFVFRLPSLQQLDSELSHSYLQHWIGAERAFDYMRVDKKVKSGRVRVILLRGIGDAVMTADYPDAALQSTLAAQFGRASAVAP